MQDKDVSHCYRKMDKNEDHLDTSTFQNVRQMFAVIDEDGF